MFHFILLVAHLKISTDFIRIKPDVQLLLGFSFMLIKEKRETEWMKAWADNLNEYFYSGQKLQTCPKWLKCHGHILATV